MRYFLPVWFLLLPLLGTAQLMPPDPGEAPPPVSTPDNFELTIPELTLSTAFRQSLLQDLSLFRRDRLGKVHPEKAWEEACRKETDAMDLHGFTSEAGVDHYYQVYAAMLRPRVDSVVEDAAMLREPLRAALLHVNDAFRCLAGGGTMYYHMSQRIPGYVEYELWAAERDDYPGGDAYMESLKTRILSTIREQYPEKTERDLSACLDTLEPRYIPPDHGIWFRVRILEFALNYL